jgi:hypothetical protein
MSTIPIRMDLGPTFFFTLRDDPADEQPQIT